MPSRSPDAVISPTSSRSTVTNTPSRAEVTSSNDFLVRIVISLQVNSVVVTSGDTADSSYALGAVAGLHVVIMSTASAGPRVMHSVLSNVPVLQRSHAGCEDPDG